MPRVTILYKTLPSYRLEFFDGLRIALADHEIDLELVYGDPYGAEAMKGDSRGLPWAIYRPNRFVSLGRRHAIWQPALDLVRGSDLVVVEQASRLLVNYPLLAASATGLGPRVALWGHGANLQRHTASRISEVIKKRYSRLPHWWFAYTEGSRRRVSSLGFPDERITVVQNAVDTRAISEGVASEEVRTLADNLLARTGASRGHVALFMGSLYSDKRLPFLIEAAAEARSHDPYFVLLIAGDGPHRDVAEAAADAHNYIHYLGRVDGRERLVALAASEVLLMPGLVGLAILDGFAAGLPIVTTDLDFHSPEIEYLVPGENGVMLPDGDAAGYGREVADLLADRSRLTALQRACVAAAEQITAEEMVRRFTAGVLGALAR